MCFERIPEHFDVLVQFWFWCHAPAQCLITNVHPLMQYWCWFCDDWVFWGLFLIHKREFICGFVPTEFMDAYARIRLELEVCMCRACCTDVRAHMNGVGAPIEPHMKPFCHICNVWPIGGRSQIRGFDRRSGVTNVTILSANMNLLENVIFTKG